MKHTRASGGEPGSDRTAATTPRLTSARAQLPPGSKKGFRFSFVEIAFSSSPFRDPEPPIQSPSPSAAGGVSRVTSPLLTSTRTMASPAPHVVCTTSASFPSQGSATSGADAYKPGNAPRFFFVSTPKTSLDGFPSLVQSMTRSAHVAACAPVTTARSCETYARFLPSGEKRGHSAEGTSFVSKTADFVSSAFISVFARSGSGADTKNRALGLLKQNTKPRRLDVLLKFVMSPSHAAQTIWSDSLPNDAGAHAGPEATTASPGKPFGSVTEHDSSSSTYKEGDIFPTSCSPQSSRHSPRPRHPRLFVEVSFWSSETVSSVSFVSSSPSSGSGSFFAFVFASLVTPIPHSGVRSSDSGASATYATRVSFTLQLTPPNVPSTHKEPCVEGGTKSLRNERALFPNLKRDPRSAIAAANFASRATSRFLQLGETLESNTPLSSIPKLGWRKRGRIFCCF
jgi:hypothetical protein